MENDNRKKVFGIAVAVLGIISALLEAGRGIEKVADMIKDKPDDNSQ